MNRKHMRPFDKPVGRGRLHRRIRRGCGKNCARSPAGERPRLLSPSPRIRSESPICTSPSARSCNSASGRTNSSCGWRKANSQAEKPPSPLPSPACAPTGWKSAFAKTSAHTRKSSRPCRNTRTRSSSPRTTTGSTRKTGLRACGTPTRDTRTISTPVGRQLSLTPAGRLQPYMT